MQSSNHAAYAERLNLTIRRLLARIIATRPGINGRDAMQLAVGTYNRSQHSSLPPGYSPERAFLWNERGNVLYGVQQKRLKEIAKRIPRPPAKFAVGDHIRIFFTPITR